ncbi:leucine-rich repeat flightless-interacting protein 1 isoform X4 [Kryptolebias marmoratus]|uniref:leucine-rich repeat flightless-interacting protein 1 isoform X4 n=1 Tax=Kryptolebias marmoratus TaxID=37003 RepID=UPI000D5306DE|nr:leucine-rich repeat flightless-interacting protein 1 isoform X4 [Kryptolebias marmoratus]
MGTQGTGRRRSTKKERATAEEDALNLIAREAEARLAVKRAARAEAREIRLKELERQQKEIFQVQKKYYGLNTKLDERADGRWGDIEQWMEDSEKYSRSSGIPPQSDDDERMSVGSRGSVRSDLDSVGAYGGGGSSSLKKSKKKKKHKHRERDKNGFDDDYSVLSSRSSRLSDESRMSRSSRADLQPASYSSSDLFSLNDSSSCRNQSSAFNGYQSSVYEDSLCSGPRRVPGSGAHPLELGAYRGSRASSRTSSARTSPVVEDKDYPEKGSRAASALTATTLTSLGGTSSRRGSGDTSLTVHAEIKEIHDLKDQIQDVESKFTQNLKEAKDALAEAEEKYRKAMVSNAQLDNEKNNLMYQVDTLKDSLMELEELLSESRREHEEKLKEFEREKHAHAVLQFQFAETKETLKQSEELLNEIRQLRLKQDGFVREVSDLQETVEWKDKKIGALERQKEYSDAIRVERDELREEAVKLKDILKKHGIVLGPDLSVNGEVDEPASRPAPDPSPAEGNSMLGSTEEDRDETGPEQEVDGSGDRDLRDSNTVFIVGRDRDEIQTSPTCPHVDTNVPDSKQEDGEDTPQEVLKQEIPADEPAPNPEPENPEGAENDDAEENRSQPQGSSSGKKRRKKRKGKKKGSHENKNQQTGKEDEPDTRGSVPETLERDNQEPDKVDAAEPGEPKSCSQEEPTPDRVSEELDPKPVEEEEAGSARTSEHLEEKQNEDKTLKGETLEPGEPKSCSQEELTPDRVSEELDPKPVEEEEVEVDSQGTSELLENVQNKEETPERENVEPAEPGEPGESTESSTVRELIPDPVSDEPEERRTSEAAVPPETIRLTEAAAENAEGQNEGEPLDTETVEPPESFSNREPLQEPTSDQLPGEPEEGITSSEEPGTLRGAEDVQEREEPLETENIEPVEPPESFCPQEPIMDRVSDELGGDNAVVACEETANEDGVELGENQRNKEDSLEEPAESSPRVEGSEGTVTDGKTGEAEEKEPVVSPQITEDLSSGAETSDRGPDHTESKTLNETIPEPEKSGADGDVVEPELAVAATSTSAAPPLIHPDPGPEENWADDGEPTPKTADEDETEPGAPPETDGSERRRPSLPTEDGTGSTNQADSRPETKAEDLSPTQSSEETEPASPEPSNAQQDQETGPAGLGPRAEQMDEDSGQEAEDIDPPRASQQDGHDEDDDEDDDEEEGQSFDFDDLDMEAAIESNVSIIPEEEDVEEGLEVKSDEDIVSSGLGQTDPEDKPADGGDEVDHLVTEPDAVLQEKQNSLPPEDVCEEEEKRLGDEESAVAPGDVSASVKKGLDVIELDLESPKTGEDNVPNREAPQSGKDAKKSTKKGKGKGKEDCKMS